jgi:hypothetical protein
MKLSNHRYIGIGWLCLSLLFAAAACAQTQKAPAVPQRNQAYSVSRETVLQGTVLKYTAESLAAPLGAHVTVETSSGAVDVHIGSAKLLENNHFTLAAGDQIKVVGESLPYGNGTQFFARLMEKGSQSIAVRGIRGLPLRSVKTSSGKPQGGVL